MNNMIQRAKTNRGSTAVNSPRKKDLMGKKKTQPVIHSKKSISNNFESCMVISSKNDKKNLSVNRHHLQGESLQHKI